MRSRIFTEKERKALLKWLKGGGREPYINTVLSRANQNGERLLADCKLLTAVLKRYDDGY